MDLKLRILIVEDEQAIREGLVDLLVYHGYQVEALADGKQGLSRALEEEFDLVVLDVMLPGKDGFSICEELRKARPEQLIIMLTARTSEEDIVSGLSLGADDYIAKPFSVRELVLRVEAILRRGKKVTLGERTILVADGMEIDTKTLVGVKCGSSERKVEFTRREVGILQYLLKHRDRPVPRGELLDEVWGYKRAEAIETRTVDIHIAKLRRKIEPDPKNPRFLVTTRGEGYQLLAQRQGS
ncbi:MAG: DNA-binding response regulator [Proteobacteria bacterium]|nr:MAG: DNA-binding response regulator [Pseudomonadota bacterium]